eukprot:gene56456-4551_t
MQIDEWGGVGTALLDEDGAAASSALRALRMAPQPPPATAPAAPPAGAAPTADGSAEFVALLGGTREWD